MGSLWGLALSLFFCFWEAGAAGSSAGPSTRKPGLLVTMNHTELPAVTLGVNTSSEGASHSIGLAEPSVQSHIPLETQTLDTQTFDRILIPASTISESETRETKTIFSATETRALTKITPSKFMVVMTVPVETSATSGSSSEAGATTMETVTGSDLLVFGILCTDDSSEETKRITTDALPLAHMSAEARALALENSSVPAITSSQTLAPDITVPSKALVAYTIADIAVTNCSTVELETTAIIAGTSDIDHSPTGERGTLSTPETSALPDFTEAKSYLTKIMTSSETLSTASTPDTTVETPHTANSTTEGESTAAQAATSSGTLMTITINPLEQTLPLSVETASHTKVSGAVTISTEAGSTVGKVTSSAGSSGMIYSLSEIAPIQKYTHSETSTTHSTTSGPVPISRSSIPSVLLTTTNSSQETGITSAKTTASAKTSKTASTAGGKPAATPTTSQTRWTTEDTTDGDEGFLLLRLSVASPEDLTDPRVAKRLMYQLHHELHTHMPPTQVSLLHVRRD
ncbi:mucin-20 [Phyllostomus hastatus]|uniref:mucin-20 n=1 Tax=Phyllostomus hastatus TaxID=9423 RepID=UPI001E68537C|nr:mucin-20 [Phyllostomus hastatus]